MTGADVANNTGKVGSWRSQAFENFCTVSRPLSGRLAKGFAFGAIEGIRWFVDH
jgi:hypothetical protein